MSEIFIHNLEQEGYSHITFIRGKGLCGLRRFMFTTGLVIGLTKDSYGGRYCYTNHADALEALKKWEGAGEANSDPKDSHWIKYKGFGEDRPNPKNK